MFLKWLRELGELAVCVPNHHLSYLEKGKGRSGRATAIEVK